MTKPKAKFLDNKPQMYCELCDLMLTGHAPYTAHLAGKKHLKKLKAAGSETPVKGPQGQPDSTVADSGKKVVEGYSGKFVTQSKAVTTTTTPTTEQTTTNQPTTTTQKGSSYSYSQPGSYEGYGTGQTGQYDYSGQYGYGEGYTQGYGQGYGQYDYSGQGFVTQYPNVGQQASTPTTTTPKAQDPNDPVMKAVRDNLMGKLPTKRKAEKMTERCEVCQLDYSSQAHKEQHLAGKKHAKKVKIHGADGKTSLEALYCDYCKLQLNSPEQHQQHLEGSTHRKKVKAKTGQDPGVPQQTDLDNTGPSPAKRQFVPTTAAQAAAISLS